jgi:hypothetical protein
MTHQQYSTQKERKKERKNKLPDGLKTLKKNKNKV